MAGAAFLEKSGKAKGAKVMPSGLIYTEISSGSGASPGPTDTAVLFERFVEMLK